MVFVQAFLLWRCIHRARRQGFFTRKIDSIQFNLVDLARHQLHPRLAIGHATPVGEGDPSVQIHELTVGRQVSHIVRPPTQTAGEIRQLEGPGPGLGRLQVQDQGGLVPQVRGQIGKGQMPDQTVLDTIGIAQNHALVGGEEGRLLARALPGVIGADDLDLAAKVLLEQALGSQQVEVEILFQQADLERPGGLGQKGGLGADAGRAIAPGQAVFALGQGQTTQVLHQGQVVVVDGDGQGLLGRVIDALFLNSGDCIHGQEGPRLDEGMPGIFVTIGRKPSAEFGFRV